MTRLFIFAGHELEWLLPNDLKSSLICYMRNRYEILTQNTDNKNRAGRYEWQHRTKIRLALLPIIPTK